MEKEDRRLGAVGGLGDEDGRICKTGRQLNADCMIWETFESHDSRFRWCEE